MDALSPTRVQGELCWELDDGSWLHKSAKALINLETYEARFSAKPLIPVNFRAICCNNAHFRRMIPTRDGLEDVASAGSGGTLPPGANH